MPTTKRSSDRFPILYRYLLQETEQSTVSSFFSSHPLPFQPNPLRKLDVTYHPVAYVVPGIYLRFRAQLPHPFPPAFGQCDPPQRFSPTDNIFSLAKQALKIRYQAHMARKQGQPVQMIDRQAAGKRPHPPGFRPVSLSGRIANGRRRLRKPPHHPIS